MKKNSLALGILAGAFGLAVVGCDPAKDSDTTDDLTQEAVTGTFQLQNTDTSRCVDVAGSSKSNGALLQEQDCKTRASQQWTFKPIGDGIYNLVNGNSGKCVAVKDGSKTPGASLVQASCDSNDASQTISLHKSATHTFRIKSRGSMKCIAPANGNNGAQLVLQSCDEEVPYLLTNAPTSGGGGGGGGGGTGGKGGSSGGEGGSSGGAGKGGGDDNLVWKKAELTNFESYPDPGSEECIKYSGCDYVGQFAALDGQQSESWVKAHNIAAVHHKDFAKLKLHTVRVRQGSHTIDAKVYDECADSDCDGCCTQNAKPSGYLLDLEKYTYKRFGGSDGQVDWACLDCN